MPGTKRKEAPPLQSQGEDLTQVNVKSVPVDVLRKLQTIADIEGVSYTELYNKAFSSFISRYELKNGKVKLKEKGRGLEGL